MGSGRFVALRAMKSGKSLRGYQAGEESIGLSGQEWATLN